MPTFNSPDDLAKLIGKRPISWEISFDTSDLEWEDYSAIEILQNIGNSFSNTISQIAEAFGIISPNISAMQKVNDQLARWEEETNGTLTVPVMKFPPSVIPTRKVNVGPVKPAFGKRGRTK